MKRMPFDAESIAGILAGIKTETSRVIRPQPERAPGWTDTWIWQRQKPPKWAEVYVSTAGMEKALLSHCPYSVGDVVAATETFALHPTATEMNRPIVFYKARGDTLLPPNRWRSSRFMPAAFSRITIEITSTGAARVQNLTYAQIVAEGFVPELTCGRLLDATGMRIRLRAANDWWRAHWDGINAKKYPYDSNPWVWRYRFNVIRLDRPVKGE